MNNAYNDVFGHCAIPISWDLKHGYGVDKDCYDELSIFVLPADYDSRLLTSLLRSLLFLQTQKSDTPLQVFNSKHTSGANFPG